jgi:selenium-binding protein 1
MSPEAGLDPLHSFYRSPKEAMEAPPEQLAYVALLDPDAIAVVDVDPGSATYGQVVGKWDAPHQGNEFHHYGWNLCSSALGGDHHHGALERRYLVVPGIRSSRIYVLDTGPDPRQPTLLKTVEPAEVLGRSGYSRPHTVHCGPHGLFVSALGHASADGEGGPAGIFLMDHDTFEVREPWERDHGPQTYAYDFWWSVEANTLVASEWAPPALVENGLDADALVNRRYGHRLHFFDLETRRHLQSVDLGDQHQMALEVRPAHDPSKTYGFLGVVVDVTNLASSIWTWYRENGRWQARKTIEIPATPVDPDKLPPLLKGFGAVPPLVTDIDLSLDDRYLYVACWGSGELRQYDVTDPLEPRLNSQVELGGLLHRAPHPSGRPFAGGPQMVEVSRDGRRVYGTNSLYGSWDPQFYPEGIPGAMYKASVSETGLMALEEGFLVQFPGHRAHQVRLQGGDCSTDSFCFTN